MKGDILDGGVRIASRGYLNGYFWIIFGLSVFVLAYISKVDQDHWQKEYDDQCKGVDEDPNADPALTHLCKKHIEDNLMHAKGGVLVWSVMCVCGIVAGIVFCYIQFRKDVDVAQEWQRSQHISSAQVENAYQQSQLEQDPDFVAPIEEKRTCTNCGTQTTGTLCPNCRKPVG